MRRMKSLERYVTMIKIDGKCFKSPRIKLLGYHESEDDKMFEEFEEALEEL